jgi:hypothetical protein
LAYLNTRGNVVVVAGILSTHRAVGKVAGCQVKLLHWYAVHILSARPCEVQWSAQVCGVDADAVCAGGEARGEETI